MRLLPAILALLCSMVARAAACDLRFADEAAFAADWAVGPNLAWAKSDEIGQRLFLAECRDCVPSLSLSLRATDLSTGADPLSRMMQARPLNQILDDPKAREELLLAYQWDQGAMNGGCPGGYFSGRREIGGATFAVLSSQGTCWLTGSFQAVEYLGIKNGCGYRIRFTWPGVYPLQKEPFERARQLLLQVRLSP
jgi:hypothetical protein